MHPSVRSVFSAASLVFAGASAHAAAPSGWQRVLSHKGTCTMSVPTDWKANPMLKSDVATADASAGAVIHTDADVTTLAELKPLLLQSMKPTKTFEDSPQRWWFQYQGGGGTSWYVGVPGKHGVCGAQIGFKHAAMTDTAKKIALSVGSVP